MNKYRFKEEGHRHELLVDGIWKPLTGVTTVLSVIAKPALIQWAANMAVDYCEQHLSELQDVKLWKEVFTEARKAHCRKKEEAGEKGIDIHAIIEEIIKDAIKDNLGYVKGENVLNENEQIKHFAEWATQNKVKFLESELGLYSEKLFIGGIVDFVCKIDGEVWVGDIKTGNGIYAEAFWQCAAYQICLEEMKKYQNIKGHIILNLKKDGTFTEKRSISNEDNKQAFLAALTIYRIKNKVENNLIN